MRVVNLLFLVAFLLSVVVQVNDPDPWRWMALYGAAAGACVAWERRLGPRWLPLAPAFVALGWGLSVLGGIPEGAQVLPAVSDWQMKAGGSEEIREVGGLGLVLLWMGVLAVRSRR